MNAKKDTETPMEASSKISSCKVTLEDSADVRLALDQSMLEYFKKAHKFKESIFDSNFQLILAVFLNALSGITAILSHKFKFHAVKLYIGLLSALYLGIYMLINLHSMLFKRNFLFSGYFPAGASGKNKLLRIYSSFDTGKAEYRVEFEVQGISMSLVKECSVATLFYENGTLNVDAFAGFLEQSISELQSAKKNE